MNRVAATLEGERLFITGATGFLGTVMVEKLLWSVPDLGRLLLLMRGDGTRTAADRLVEDVIGSPAMARLAALHGADWPAWAASKLEAIPGDLRQDRFGLTEDAYGALAERVDRVVANAATVTFDERLDRALEINADGALRHLQLARDAGDVPLLHVSTCFVSGRRTGVVEESVVTQETLDDEVVRTALDNACAALRDRDVARDRAWVEAGAAQAERFGFNDIYTFTKALGERMIDRHRGSVPVSILRPAIVESAIAEPIAGWIEGIRVSDPLLVAYGRGRAQSIPGNPDARLSLIPVDHVVNAAIVALASMSAPSPESSSASGTSETPPIAVYQASSDGNPITLEALLGHARRGFARAPLRDEDGSAIPVPEARFVDAERYARDLERQRRRLRRWRRWLPLGRASKKRQAWGSAERTLDHLIHLLSVYRPYFDHGARYDDSGLRDLWSGLSEDARKAFPFDVTTIDWASYIAETHVPGLVRFALRADSGAPVPASETRRECDEAILARAHDHAVAAKTVFELFASTAASCPDVVAFQTCRQGRWLRYRYGQALDATASIALRLRDDYGIGAGDRVVLWSNGRPEWALVALAIHRLGAVIVPIDPQWPVEEMAAGARFVDAKLIIAQPRLADVLETGSLSGPVARLDSTLVPGPDVGLLPGADQVGVSGSAQDLASVIFTSGTTVAPKAVPLTHANYLANVRDLVPLMNLVRERLVSVLPVHHVFEQMVGWLVPMTGGATFSYVPEIKPAEISWMMTTTRPTVLVAVPRLLELLHGGIMANVAAGGPMLRTLFKVLFALSRRQDGARGHKLFAKVHRRFGGSLRRIATGGSALDPKLGRSFQLMGFMVAEGYGMTETSPVLTVNPWDRVRFGSVGVPLPGVDIDLRPIADRAGLTAGLESGAGEIWVRGANVMSGYLDDDEATESVFSGGWLNTGDIGYFDDDRYLHVCGRTKDVIVTAAGKNVYPEEVEARYADTAGVEELVAIGIPSSDGGAERLIAVVVPKPGADEAAIRRAIDDRSRSVPSYQVVSSVALWTGELPKTTTMKVKRAVLRDAVLAGDRGGVASAASPAAPPAAPAEGPPEPPRSPEQTTVVDIVARVTRTRADLVTADDRLADLGVDSLTRVELIGALEAQFGVRLDDETAAGLERVEDLYGIAAR